GGWGSFWGGGGGEGGGGGGGAFRLWVRHDRVFGPVLALQGRSEREGVAMPEAHRVTPLTQDDAEGMIRKVMDWGDEDLPTWSGGLVETLLRVSLMAHNLSEVEEVEMGRVACGDEGVELGEVWVRVKGNHEGKFGVVPDGLA
ncbi:MAG TPA: hypothetical protein PKE55_07370, partial [Kiritimatiellia bacterium]|nr:hypothetical protein [Kiritimatiellia bacterium]